MSMKQWIEKCISDNPELAKKIIRENAILIERFKGIIHKSGTYKEARVNLLNHHKTVTCPVEKSLSLQVYQSLMGVKEDATPDLNDFESFYSKHTTVVEGTDKSQS